MPETRPEAKPEMPSRTASSVSTSTDSIAEALVLVEDVSIDGMCGVY